MFIFSPMSESLSLIIAFFFFLFSFSIKTQIPAGLVSIYQAADWKEAQARTQAQVNSPIVTENKYIEVGEGPAALQGEFHTIIEFPLER